MFDLENDNSLHQMTKSDFGFEKVNKSSELNDGMSISESGADEYENKLHNLGGSN